MKYILIVEDEPSIAQMYQLKLELNNYKALIAHNGLIGLKCLDSFQPDLILLDLMMPIMNGEEFLSKLRKMEAHQNIPVIILTNVSREEAPKTLWHYGISDYFVKAHNTPNELLNKIRLLSDFAGDYDAN